jgi:hypothetical protein
MKISFEKVELRALIENCFRVISFMMEKKNLKPIIHIHSSVPKWIITDPLKLKQILINLLSNAIKATDKGSITISVSHQTKLSRFDKILSESFSSPSPSSSSSPSHTQKQFENYNDDDEEEPISTTFLTESEIISSLDQQSILYSNQVYELRLIVSFKEFLSSQK